MDTLDAWGLFEKNIEHYPITSPEEQLATWAAYDGARGTREGQKLFSELAGANWRLAKKVVSDTLTTREKSVGSDEFAELASEANVALCEAIETFDPERGGSLSGYVATCVERRLSGVLTGDLPATWSKVQRIAGAVEQGLMLELGRRPSSEELTQKVQEHCIAWAKERLEEAGEEVNDASAKAKLVRQGTWVATTKLDEIRSRGAVLSLDLEMGEGTSLLDTLSDGDNEDAIDVVGWLLSSLSGDDRYLVTRRYGLDGQGEAKFEDLASERGWEWPQVRSRIAAAMGRMFAPHAQYADLATGVLGQIVDDDAELSPVGRLARRRQSE